MFYKYLLFIILTLLTNDDDNQIHFPKHPIPPILNHYTLKEQEKHLLLESYIHKH